jgi:hypothetical protein
MSTLSKAKSVLPQFPKTDKRLLGIWKSDKRRTFAEWNWKRKISSQKKAKIRSLFGKLEVTYTRTKVISVLPHRDWGQARRYAMLAMDDTSVAIVKFGEIEIMNRRKYDPENLKMVEALFGAKLQIEHIHFEKRHFWISIGNGRNREFFRKIRDAN